MLPVLGVQLKRNSGRFEDVSSRCIKPGGTPDGNLESTTSRKERATKVRSHLRIVAIKLFRSCPNLCFIYEYERRIHD